MTVEPNDVLLNITGDSILRTCVVDDEVLPARVNQHVAIIRARRGISSRFLHQHLVMQSSKDRLLGNDAGASRPAITKGHLEAFRLICPPQPLMAAFDQITGPLFQHIAANNREARSLAAARDLLLPKLMSGELSVRNVERELEAAL